MNDLYRRSIEIILAGQAASGAYIAAPTYPNYQYAWLRDGSYTAYAMDLVRAHASSRKFHAWVAETILRYADRAEAAIERARRAERILDGPFLPARYTLDGCESREPWHDFQLDGYGSWLWALEEHLQLSRPELPRTWTEAVRLVARYLDALWKEPCFDCWEEPVPQLYTYTLATAYAGLQAAAHLLGETRYTESARRLRDFLSSQLDGKNGLGRVVGAEAVDASLLGVSTPCALMSADDPCMKATVARIESELRQSGGGVHRYAADTFYGGGEWVLLTAWLAWYYAEVGQRERARELLSWVEAQADESGNLPEQVPRSLRDPEMYERWRSWWGESANPLLWSHAMYLIAQFSANPRALG